MNHGKRDHCGVCAGHNGFFAAPLAANAAGYSGGTATVSGAAVPGGTVTVNFSAGSSVAIQVSGTGAVTIGAFKADVASTTKTAGADGSTSARVSLPSNAAGTYTVTGTDAAGNS